MPIERIELQKPHTLNKAVFLESFEQIIAHLTERIDKQGRARGRSSNAKQNLMTGVRHLIAQLWKGSRIHEGYEAGINKRSGWYSENGRYRQAGLTYRQTFAAYEGLLNLGIIQENHNRLLR